MKCISCGLDSEKVDKNSLLRNIKKDINGDYHWKECHNVGGDVNANISIYSSED